MTVEDAIKSSAELWALLPAEVEQQLGDVRIEVVASPSDPEVFTILHEEGLELEEPPEPGTRGLFLGFDAEPSDDETDDADPPVGVILLFAESLPNDEAVKLTLCHEIGHALGMDEAEVEALGLG